MCPRTSDAPALLERGDVWRKELAPGAIGFLGVTAGVTADGRAITIARFESEAAARANSQRPEQGEWWQGTAAPYTDARPDLLGGLRVWTGTDTCVDVAYVTSEAEARKGEQAEMPEDSRR